MANRFNVSKTATCDRCGSNRVYWQRSRNGRSWYLINVAADNTTSTRDFHSVTCAGVGAQFDPGNQAEADLAALEAAEDNAPTPVRMITPQPTKNNTHFNLEVKKPMITFTEDHIDSFQTSLVEVVGFRFELPLENDEYDGAFFLNKGEDDMIGVYVNHLAAEGARYAVWCGLCHVDSCNTDSPIEAMAFIIKWLNDNAHS